MYRKILATFDLTHTDEAMIVHLIEMARAFSSEIILIRVINAHLRDEMNIAIEKADRYLSEIVERLARAGLKSTKLIVHGEPDKVIIQKAEELGVDLIIIGTHGHKGLLDILFGSVASRVRHETGIPVLLIKRKNR